MVRDDDFRRLSMRFAVAWAAIASWLFAPGAFSVAQEFRGPFAVAVEGLTPEESAGEKEDEHIETDRDSFTPATTLVGRGRVMIEGSYSFIDNRNGPDSNSYPEILTRVGLTDWFELRLGWNYEAGGGGSVSGTEVGGDEESAAFETESKVLYGFKVAVTDQDIWLPARP